MEIKVNSKDLLKVLNAVSKAVPQKASIPIQECFFLNIFNDNLLVAATDGNFSIISNCDAQGDGQAVIPASTLLALVRTLPDCEVVITTDKESAKVEWNTGNIQLPTFPVADYPSIPEAPKKGYVEVDSAEMLNALRHTIPCTGNDAIRPVLSGVFINATANGTDVVASDSHILTAYTMGAKASEAVSFILPSNAASAVKDSLTEGTISFAHDNGLAYFVVDRSVISCRTTVGKYPNYNAVIPKDHPNTLVCNVRDFVSAIKRVAICSSKSVGAVKLELNAIGAVATAQDLGFGVSATENLDIESYEGNDLAIGVKAELLLKVLGTLQDANATIKLGTEKQAILIPSEVEPCKTIIMPIQVQ